MHAEDGSLHDDNFREIAMRSQLRFLRMGVHAIC
jgi:hypothetical protein